MPITFSSSFGTRRTRYVSVLHVLCACFSRWESYDSELRELTPCPRPVCVCSSRGRARLWWLRRTASDISPGELEPSEGNSLGWSLGTNWQGNKINLEARGVGLMVLNPAYAW